MPIATRRAKVSVTVDPKLLRVVDDFVEEHPEADRSKVFEEALLLWYRTQEERAMEAQFRAPPSAQEAEERAAWRRIRRAAAERRFRPE